MIAPLSSLPDFDPRLVPVVGVDAHLPAVPVQAQTAEALRARFAHPPQWEPEVLLEKKFMNREPAHASVLLAIMLREQPTVLLTERTAHLSTHSGQVAFPGGRADPGDATPAATALREAQEEVGLAPEFVEVLGTLPTYVTGSSFIITPVVALVRPDCVLQPNPYEVADLFEVPLAFLLDPAHHQRHRLPPGVEVIYFSMDPDHPVLLRHLAGRVVLLGKFGRHVDLRAAPVVGPPQPLADPLHVGLQLACGVLGMLRRHRIPQAPEVHVFTLQKRHDEVVLGGEVAVQAGLGHGGFGHHQVHPHGAHTALVEQARRRVEDALAHVLHGLAGGRRSAP